MCVMGACRFEILRNTRDGSLSYCTRCFRKVVVRKGYNGATDDRTYLKTHRRDFLQPFGKTAREFKREYGEPNVG